ncbi:DNA repair photolyase [Methanofollis sp. W23]|uniref:SPL family radical SAM protein n=1 Tax=Methanofollis sp. W23 TaxID=2817849 RepID=UPI001AE58857|nr:radical SAM protein [Methanofollis sp. W23]MBP2147221.1 DNA repair photolyase [Methanofollis sp. W23]
MKLKVIYEPKGRAGEYAPLALNLYRGCDHGCTYCYGPRVLHMKRPAFAAAEPRKDILDKLLLDCDTLNKADNDKTILLCFTCDPYCRADEEHKITREALKMLLTFDQPVTILTKGGNRSLRDFDILERHAELVTCATTLTFEDEAQRQLYEPGAAPTQERLDALAKAKACGFRTWVSCEPVIDPDQTMSLIRKAAPYTDLFKVGKWNYDQRAKETDWHAFGNGVVSLLESLGADYYIKEDLRPYCEGVC